jgi:hypothetical protein
MMYVGGSKHERWDLVFVQVIELGGGDVAVSFDTGCRYGHDKTELRGGKETLEKLDQLKELIESKYREIPPSQKRFR